LSRARAALAARAAAALALSRACAPAHAPRGATRDHPVRRHRGRRSAAGLALARRRLPSGQSIGSVGDVIGQFIDNPRPAVTCTVLRPTGRVRLPLPLPTT
jgi:hypothetical protein